MSMVRKWTVGRALALIVLLGAAAISVFPFIWMIVGMTLNPNDVLKGILIPGRDFVSNWTKATTSYNLPIFFFNSL
jgi:lactose/L-arabinose transport system permease protein